MPDGTYPVSFDPGDVASLSSGVFMNAVHFYTMDVYDGDAIRGLAAGDTVYIGEDPILVTAVELQDSAVVVNGTAFIPSGVGFNKYNTTVRIEGGIVMEIDRAYVS